MTALSIIQRRCRGAVIALTMIALMAIWGSNQAHAQFNCGPCNNDATYRVVIDAWPVALGFAAVQVDFTDRGTGTGLNHIHTNLVQGSVVNQQFNPSNPGHTYDITDVTLTYCSNHVIFQIPCDNLSYPNPHVECVTASCNGSTYCIKFKFQPAVPQSPSATPCWTISIKAVSGACSDPCTY
jgi:hypothetical protein